MDAEKILAGLCGDWHSMPQDEQDHIRSCAISFIREHTGKPVAWMITDQGINDLQIESINKVISRAWAAHHVDLIIRINRVDERHQADWLKHLTRAKK